MKKQRLKNFFKLGILLLGIPILFFACDKDEPKHELDSNFKTVPINDALNFLNLNNQNVASRNSTGNYLISVSDDIAQEEITNSNELLTILPATTVYDHHYSRVLLLEIDNEIQSVVFSMIADENSTTDIFSGDVLITDLDGNFLNGYKVLNGVLSSEYFENNYQSRNGELTVTSQSNPDCPDCPFSVCSYCDALDEVVIIAGGGGSPPPINYIIIWTIFDQGNGSGDNSWDPGGGSSGSNSGGTSASSNDPCDKINSLGTNTDFKNKMTDLENSTGLNYEKGYYIGLNGENSYTPVNGNSNQPYIDINPPSPISGFMHSHYGLADSMFSPDDILALYQLYDYGHMQNASTFTFSVVTQHGTSYTIMIDDIATFSNFGIANLSSQATFDTWLSAYSINYFTLFANGTNQIDAREIAMLKALEDSGLILTKGTSNFDDWKKLGLDRNDGIISGDCN